MPLKVRVLTCEIGMNPSTPNDNPESVISVAGFMVKIYLLLVKIVEAQSFLFLLQTSR